MTPVATPAPAIAVVIPTRDGGVTLRTGLRELRRLAAEPSAVEVVILDNGSREAETQALLAELSADGSVRVLRDDTPFNWSRLSNAGAAASDAPLLLFMNDDVIPVSPGWDDVLRHHLARAEIGAVGIRLDYPDGGVQHGGVVFGPNDRGEHEGVAVVGVTPDIVARWDTRRRIGAVTGAFLACRRTDFEALGRFDAINFPIWFNDVDFCLRLREAGLIILYDPAIRAIHHESKTLSGMRYDATRQALWDASLAAMRSRWGQALTIDPGFNPHFARVGRPFEAITEPSPHAIRDHLARTSRSSPWRIKRNDPGADGLSYSAA